MDYIVDYLKKEIKDHNLKSGEIIFEYDSSENAGDLTIKLNCFFQKNNIKTEKSDPVFSEITQTQAAESIKYGLSTKANYTVIDTEFDRSDQHRILNMFLSLFKQPRYYTTDCKLYQAGLDINDFWETGGAIAVDSQHIGILWTNDLYDKHV
jgi:hypothetical protein